MFAKQRLYLTADRNQVVAEGDVRAAFLYAGIGDEIPDSAAERFGLVDGAIKKPKPSRADTLLGSSILPAMVELAPGVAVQLGNVVAHAHKASGLTVDAWNALPADDREALLASSVKAMKARQAARPAKGVGAKKAAANKEQKPGADKEQKPGENKGAQP